MVGKTPIEMMLDRVEWKMVQGPTVIDHGDGSFTSKGPALPIATHEGVWEIGEHKLRCYRLSDGRAVIHADDIEKFFGSMFQETV